MNAVDLIAQNLDVEKILDELGFSYTTGGDICRLQCPLHGGNQTPAFVINNETGLWWCHGGDCGGGTIYQLLMKHLDISFPEAVQWVANLHGIDINNLEIITPIDKKVKSAKKWMKFVNERKSFENPEYSYPDKTYRVKSFRNFGDISLQLLRFVPEFHATTREGKDFILRDRLLIEIWENNRLVGVTMRRTNPNDVPKWYHQPPGLKSTNMLYGFDECKKYIDENDLDEVILVEGCFDVWAFREQGIHNVVATFGVNVSSRQIKMLMGIATTLVLAYDSDSGGILGSQKVIRKTKNIFDLFVIPFDVGDDPESCDNLRIKYDEKVKYYEWENYDANSKP